MSWYCAALECQAPFTEYILCGKKSIETRRYVIPNALLNKPIWLMQSIQGELGKSTVPNIVDLRIRTDLQILGTVTFSECFKYEDADQWMKDLPLHYVSEEFMKTFEPPLYGWQIAKFEIFTQSEKPPVTLLQRQYRSIFKPVLQVPTLDITNINDHIVEEALTQCKQIGFLRITWQNFPIDFIQNTHKEAAKFFQQDLDTKTKASKQGVHKVNESFCSTGYRGVGSGYNNGGRESWSAIRPDYCPDHEKFQSDYFKNSELGQMHFAVPPDPQVPWPDELLLPNFKNSILMYYNLMQQTAEKLGTLFARVMGLEDSSALKKFMTQHTSSLNLTNLRQNSEYTGQSVLAAHADLTCFTIISHDNSHGAIGPDCLEVQNPFATGENDYRWIALADSISPSTLLVNIGQILERWSAGLLKATIHRVIRNQTTFTGRRQALIYFQNTNYDLLLKPLCSPSNGANMNYLPEKMYEYSQRRLSPFYDSTITNEEAFAIYNQDIISRLDYLELTK